jgi:hypothetical protein
MNWKHDTDPHGIIPVGWINPGQYEVVCFLAPAGTDVLALMIGVKYPNHQSLTHDYSTTRCYIDILRDYLARASHDTIFKAQDAWREKRTKEFLEIHPDCTWAVLEKKNEG